jgi:hypothetical protein
MYAARAERGATGSHGNAQLGGERASVEKAGGHSEELRRRGNEIRRRTVNHSTLMEFVRKEVWIGSEFSAEDFSRAFARFRELYNVAPKRLLCSPDVVTRFCVLYQPSERIALEYSARLEYEGVPLVAGILAPGTIALEGEVDEERMGDW